MMKISRKQLKKLIFEELYVLRETTQAFPGTMPVDVPDDEVAQDLDAQIAAEEEAVKNAKTSGEKALAQANLQMSVHQHDKTARAGMAEVNQIFEDKELSFDARIDALETLLKVFFDKDEQGAGYVMKISDLEKRVSDLESSDSSSDDSLEPGQDVI
jgi:N-methylhydantoinase B/oxoprolinase/acetone carboxylase alpha subunit